MSLSNFKRAVGIGRLSEADREWFPRWFASYADFVSRMVPIAVGTEVIQTGSQHTPTNDNANLPVNQSLVIGFLRTLRDQGVEHWRRLQAARAIAYYHTIVVRDEAMDFKPIIEKLQELAGRQQHAGIDPTGEGRQSLAVVTAAIDPIFLHARKPRCGLVRMGHDAPLVEAYALIRRHGRRLLCPRLALIQRLPQAAWTCAEDDTLRIVRIENYGLTGFRIREIGLLPNPRGLGGGSAACAKNSGALRKNMATRMEGNFISG